MIEKLYMEGNITFTEAARRAGLSLWDMHKELVAKGFKSEYSGEDLRKELESIADLNR